jgi:starch-binding outer membrane protein, SusD/RagB family
MKRINFKILVVVLLLVASCNENEWLKEEPLDMFTAENAFATPTDIESGIARIYDIIRSNIYQGNQYQTAIWFTGTDLGMRGGEGIANRELNDFTNNLTSTFDYVPRLWNYSYDIIRQSNTVITRIESGEIEFESETQLKQLKANALFCRAFGYRLLVYVYGGVPLVLEEINSAKRDFTRATQEAVIAQMISDLEYAAENLPTVSQRKNDGWLHKAVAYHLLAETYISAGELDKSIAAASWVINNPDFALMTERFGTRKNEPGDVYWDLFRRDNQNRSSGNKEALWVSQYEYQVEGGGNSNQLERFAGPQYWLIQGPDKKGLFVGPTSHNGGRGISWTGLTRYGDTLIWESDWENDIRNSEYNILRDLIADNPQSTYFGMKVIENKLIASNYIRMETYNSTYTKNTPMGDQPDEAFTNKTTGLLSTAGAGKSYTDVYIFRLAETYLLRAEAHLLKGETGLAADDINVVRSRANASPVAAGTVDIDYILDERCRELIWEELRRLTLHRTGKIVERVQRYNRIAKNTIQDYHRLWPIPFSEIEKNIGADLEQNPGYVN